MSEIWAGLGLGNGRASDGAHAAAARAARTSRTAFLSFLAFTSLAILLGSSRLSAQTCAVTELRVAVKDRSGTAVVNAKVWLGNDAEAAATATDDDGVAEFPNPACGQLVVHAGSDGFQSVTQQIEIAGAEPVQAELTLAPASVQENLEVRASTVGMEASSSETGELQPEVMKELPTVPTTVADTLARLPGLLRSSDGSINISGAGEQHGAFVVNQADVTDPATGKFGPTLPIDVVEAINVEKAPFLTEYGHFTSGVVSVETHRGGDKWHAELNDPFPDFRIRSHHVDGLRNSTPRLLFGGPAIHDRLYLITELQYYLDKHPNLTLPYPFNESKQELVNSFTQVDYILSARHLLTASFHLRPQHINYVNPEYFNPQPVTPSYAEHGYEWTVMDRLAVGNGTLVSLVSYQSFASRVGAQGDAEMTLTPTGNTGNYFARQYRGAQRGEWMETWAPGQLSWLGRHDLKTGASVDLLENHGGFTANPINLVDLGQVLLRRIAFRGGNSYALHDVGTDGFVEDHWTLGRGLALDDGIRLERQSAAGSVRLAPRAGIAWTPFKSGRTTFRAGYGRFYDRVPLDVYAFNHFPQRIVTDFTPDGSVANTIGYANMLGTDAGPSSVWVHNRHGFGGFAPRNATWKLQVEQRISRQVLLQALYENSRSAGLVELEDFGAISNGLALQGGGRAIYRQTEISARIDWRKGQQLFLSYVHSRAQGQLNDFNGFVGDFPVPLVRPDLFSNLPTDLPNRFLAWGRFGAPLGLYILPLVEFHTGQPYTSVDALGNYVGTPNVNRFPAFFSADTRFVRDFKVRTKYTLRFSLSAFNMTNHFNALSVHANVADPQYGDFFGNYTRRYRGDFEVLF